MTSDNEIEGDTLVTDRTLELAANTYAAADRLVRCKHPNPGHLAGVGLLYCGMCGALGEQDGEPQWETPALVRRVSYAMIGQVEASERPTDPPPPGEVSP
jgi:hypothetical protein